MATGLSSPLGSLLRLVSRVACLIVIASFVIFVVHQASDASNTQQNEVSGALSPSGSQVTLPTSSSHARKSTVHRVIDEASDTVTSPFSAVTSGTTNEWAVRGTNVVLTLLVYGFGLSFLARVLRS